MDAKITEIKELRELMISMIDEICNSSETDDDTNSTAEVVISKSNVSVKPNALHASKWAKREKIGFLSTYT